MSGLRKISEEELQKILEASAEYRRTRGEFGKLADLKKADLKRANLKRTNLEGANLGWANLRWASLKRANLRWANLGWADLEGANLVGANLKGADLKGANLRETILSDAPLPSPADLCKTLIKHSGSENFNQGEWCGTCCCLAGAAGAMIGNQTLGVALIKRVLPEFDIGFLYQTEREIAIKELHRVVALHGVDVT